MTNENFDVVRNCARKVGVGFLEEYLKEPFAQELSDDKETFCDNQDFKVGLFAKLFYEFKRLKLWDEISNDDWEELCELCVTSAFDAFVRLRSHEDQASEAGR